ncbi:hypothetical protein PPUN12996_26550 [Pseudomonas putida]|nr:hypothetical protein PPUN12996_26550 [Pseudomonas putida]
MSDSTLVAKLRAENERLVALLEAHGIEWQLPAESVCMPVLGNQPLTNLDTDSKLALFRSLFKGRIDTYPLRWESRGASLGMHLPVPMNGGPESVKSHLSNAVIVASVNSYQ